MSTKSTIILSEDNEHIYQDCSDNTINIEVDNKNLVEFGKCDNGVFLSFKEDSDLGRQFMASIREVPKSFIDLSKDIAKMCRSYQNCSKCVLFIQNGCIFTGIVNCAGEEKSNHCIKTIIDIFGGN